MSIPLTPFSEELPVCMARNRHLSFGACVPPCRTAQTVLYCSEGLGTDTARLLAFDGDFLLSSGQILFHNGLRGCQQFISFLGSVFM